MSPETAWCVFLGTVFALMGVKLGLGAEDHFRSIKQWEDQAQALSGAKTSQGSAGGIVGLYRAAGIFFTALGGTFFLGLQIAPDMLAVIARHRGPRTDLLGAVFFSVAGLIMSVQRVREMWGRGLVDRVMEGVDAPAPLTVRRRLVFWSGWLLVSAFLAFGAYLSARMIG